MTTGEDGKAPTVSGRPLSGTTARGIRTTLKAIFQEAVRDELIARNPCDDLRAPSTDTHEKEPLTPQQAARFRALLDAARPKPTLVAFRLMLFAGLRRAGFCALRWSDFDEDGGDREQVNVVQGAEDRRRIPDNTLDPGTVTSSVSGPPNPQAPRREPKRPGLVHLRQGGLSLHAPRKLGAFATQVRGGQRVRGRDASHPAAHLLHAALRVRGRPQDGSDAHGAR